LDWGSLRELVAFAAQREPGKEALRDDLGSSLTGHVLRSMDRTPRARTRQRMVGRDAETVAAFRGGWLRTGDLVRRDSDGWIRVVGRLKDMIRRGGENIAAAKVEAVLSTYPDIAMSAVVPVPDPVTEEEVKAFILLRDAGQGSTAIARSIVEHAESHLARFKVPRFIL